MNLAPIHRSFAFLTICTSAWLAAAADDPVFSGPQPGEKLTPFNVVSVYGDSAGQEVDPVAVAKGKPMLLIFVHKLTRPGMALTRGLTAYAKSKSKQGVASGIVWLDDDKAKAEAYLNRAKKSLNFVVPVGVSVDGGEGPGAYGLNRNVELTILVANDNTVTANFALVQPSVSEAPKIASHLAKLLDQPAPTAQEIQKLAYPGQRMQGRPNMRRGDDKPPARDEAARRPGELRGLMTNVIASDISEEELRAAVKAVDNWVGDKKERRAQLVRMANAVLQRGLGSEMAQDSLKAWRDSASSGEKNVSDDNNESDQDE